MSEKAQRSEHVSSTSSATLIEEKQESSARAPGNSGKEKRSECRCPLPPVGNKTKRRNLVVCIDGTAKKFGKKNTHVLELYRRLVADETQLTYYDSGIGTYVQSSNLFGRMKQKIENAWSQAIALNHEKITLSAYQWLSENYVPGDRIHLLGFSRGAFQVRVISGMIKTVGLLRKGNNNQIAFAYQFYLDMMKAEAGKKGHHDAKKLGEEFKQTLCHKDVTVHFVGVWDTVSSIGATRGPSFPETVDGMLHVCVFRHALALHELRIKFLPEYANGGAGPRKGGNVKEVWFAGSHADIGGGNTETKDLTLFASPPLHWMMYEAIEHGLRIEPYQGRQSQPKHILSMTAVWKILEVYPWRRLAYDSPNRVKRWPPHLSEGRRLQPEQRIHESAVRYLKSSNDFSTKTKARFFDKKSNSWLLVQEHLDTIEDHFKIEYYSQAESIKKTIADLKTVGRRRNLFPDHLVHTLVDLVSSAVGRQSIVDHLGDIDGVNLLLDALGRAYSASRISRDQTTQAQAQKVVDVLSNVLGVFRSRPDRCNIRPSLYFWLHPRDPDTRLKAMRVFNSITGHTDSVLSIAYSPTEEIIASGSADKTVRLWDATTGEPIGEPLQGHEGPVISVTFSFDGKYIISGSADDTILLWDTETHQRIERWLAKHEGGVNSVAFSPDGKQAASGSSNGTIRLWDVEKSALERELLQQNHTIWSVSFSPSGSYIASSSEDGTIRVWKTHAHDVFKEFKKHAETVRHIAFTSDSKHIVCGSYDKTVRVLNAETGEDVFEPLCGHTDDVNAIAVSPDGRFIASGSDDHTVRLWDAQTGLPVGTPFTGHTRAVRSVAFSPDSQNVISGSADNLIMIWAVAYDDTFPVPPPRPNVFRSWSQFLELKRLPSLQGLLQDG